MSIVLQGSTSGSVTLQEPAVAGTTVLDLPAVSGTILTTGSSGQSIPKAALPTGSVLQVVQATKTDTASTSSGFADTGLSASITPTSATSKILVMVSLGGVSGNNTSFKAKLVRDSTSIYVGDAAGSRPQASAQGQTSNDYSVQSMTFSYLDSPATTSATTYKVQFGGNGSTTVYLNRTARDSNSANEDARTASSIILMEIAA